jgi:hypothetical protein
MLRCGWLKLFNFCDFTDSGDYNDFKTPVVDDAAGVFLFTIIFTMLTKIAQRVSLYPP